MAIFNLGSINADHFYQVPSLPNPGETLAAIAMSTGLGGKGANQSIAAALGGATVTHIGAVGTDGDWARRQLGEYGINTDHIAVLDMPTGHAIINVDPQGENAIVIFSSANVAQSEERIRAALVPAKPDDFCILQNETNLAPFTAELAKKKGMQVVYSAAPFDADHAQEMLPFVDLLVMNEVETTQLSNAMGVKAKHLPVPAVLVTRGADGVLFRLAQSKFEIASFPVEPVDTTGAGDTYLGYFVAGLDAEMDVKGAAIFAAAAAALQVTRPGSAAAIPALGEVKVFLEERLSA